MFNGEYICTSKYKLKSPENLAIRRSAGEFEFHSGDGGGHSPTSFLDSPVFLSNLKGEPSPTTGSFFKSQMMHGSSGGSTAPSFITSSSYTSASSNSGGFEFKPDSGCFSLLGSLIPLTDQKQQVAGEAIEVQPEHQAQPSGPSIAVKSEMGAGIDDSSQDFNNETDAQELEQKRLESQVITSHGTDDGYSWRKYGQKLVKGGEYPRSYYKCTHPTCEVKKLFERSPDGEMKEIIYKGTHDHPKPISNTEEIPRRVSDTVPEENPLDSLGRAPKDCEPSSTPEQPTCEANDNNGEAGISQLIGFTNDDDPFAKRRRMEIGEVDMNSVVKPIREPRVVVQTVSEIDILDDGYRWRKYGQKVVRGNPNPRSYYKCTYLECSVRKHVERASHDPKAVITTYEGKHNHEVPAARNSSHDTTNPSNRSLTSQIESLQGNYSVSLDLGVGFRSVPNTVPSQVHAMDAVMIEPTRYSTFPGYVNGGTMMFYGSRGNHSQGMSNKIPPVNSNSDSYHQNMGSILMGP